MARTEVLPLSLTTGVASGVGTTIDATLVTNGVKIPVGGIAHRLIIRVASATNATTAKRLYVRAGDVCQTQHASMGDLTVEVPPSAGEMLIAGLESARFNQANGLIHLDFEAGFTGTLRVEQVPWPLP